MQGIMIKNIIFDFGNVLLDWNPRYLYKDYFKDSQEMEYFLANVCTLERNSELDAGCPFTVWVRKYQKMYPQYSDAIALYHTGWPRMLKSVLPDGMSLLKEFRSEGYGIYGLTNWSAETVSLAFDMLGGRSVFDGVVVSGEEKIIKPDPRIYRLLLDRYHLEAGECVFLDDSRANVEGAAGVGINAVLYDDIGNVRKALASVIGDC